LGSLGEQIAAAFLIERGATILARNVRVGRGELDLIVALDGEVIAVEVKSATAAGDPMYHFDDDKQRQVRSLARQRRISRIDYVGVTMQPAGAVVRWLPRLG
jgi:putative endonuclease